MRKSLGAWISRVPKISARAHASRRVTNTGERRMLDDVLPTEARDEVTALRFTCIHCHSARSFAWGRLWAAKLVETGWLSPKETGGPPDDRRTGAQTETRTDREVDGPTEAQVADHVS